MIPITVRMFEALEKFNIELFNAWLVLRKDAQMLYDNIPDDTDLSVWSWMENHKNFSEKVFIYGLKTFALLGVYADDFPDDIDEIERVDNDK